MKIGIMLKGMLYAIPLFLAPCIEKLADVMQDGQWPTPQRLTFCGMLGLSAACIGLRAYFDGSAERAKMDEPAPPDATTKPPTQ